MRAALHLPPRDFRRLFPLFGSHQALEQPRTNHVCAFAHDQRPRAVFRLDNFNPRINRSMIGLRRYPRLFPFGHLRDRANVFLGSSAAAAHNIQPPAVNKSFELLRQSSRRLLIQAFFVGEPGIRIAGNRAICQRLQRAHMVRHEFRPSRAIQSQRNQVHVIERSPQRLDALPRQHRAHRFNRHRNHQRNRLTQLARQFSNRQQTRLDIARILASFQQQNVRAAFDQSAGLLVIIIAQLFKSNSARHADGSRRRPHRTCHKPRLAWPRKSIRGFAR